MHRKFIAMILAMAIAITGFSARAAQAGNNDDVAKWIAGLAALAIIGAAVSERNDNKKSRPPHSYGHKHPHADPYHRGAQGHANRQKNRHQDKQKRYGKQQHHNPYALPGKCRTKTRLQGHTLRGFSAGCLQRNNVNVHALPRDCAVRFRDRSHNQPVTLFTESCLNQRGYRIARH